MLPFLLILGSAYGIAYWIGSTGLAYWRAILGFTVAFVVAWLGVSIIGGLLVSQFSPAQAILNLIGKGFGWALFGAGLGVYRARFKLRTGEPAPTFKFPSWVLPVVGGITVVGILAAVALPAYQDHIKPSKPETNPFGQFDPSTAKLVQEPDWNKGTLTPPAQAQQNRPFSYEEATAPYPQTKTAENQEHYRQIYAAHPDADEIVEKPAFKAWVAQYPVYQGFLAKGSAQEIIGMFTAYKNQR